MNATGRRRLPDGREVPVHHNHGLRKICQCPRRTRTKCDHAWHVAFCWRGRMHRFSLDRYAGKHVAGKTDAEKLADQIRDDIRNERFQRDRNLAEPTDATLPKDGLSFEAFGETFLKEFSKAREKASWDDDAAMLGKVMAFPVTWPGATRLGQKPLAAVTEEDLEKFIGHVASVRSASTRNHYVQLAQALSRFAVRKGYRDAPFVTADSNIIRRKKVNARNRRLEPGEEEKLLAVAPPHLQRLIIAALETCCRQGELLKLQWRDVSLKRGELQLRAENTKTATTRIIPISDRLRAVLDMVKTDPNGQEFGPLAYVFGDELGHRIKAIRSAWRTAVLKAHGHDPVWVWTTRKRAGKDFGAGTLSPASRAKYRAIDLHFHDLRHEAGSRLLEAGWPLHEVQQMLGHSSLQQTSTYLNATLRGLHRSMRAFDEARGQQPPASDKPATDQTASGISCKNVASDPSCARLAPCKAATPSDDKSLIH